MIISNSNSWLGTTWRLQDDNGRIVFESSSTERLEFGGEGYVLLSLKSTEHAWSLLLLAVPGSEHAMA